MRKILSLVAATTGVAIAGASFAASAPVMNQQHSSAAAPWYVGVGLNYNANLTDDSGAADLEDSDIGGNLFVGYNVNKYFGTEVGFSYVGDQTYGKSRNNNKVEVEDQWNLHWVGNATLPVNDWFAPYAFGGVGYMTGQTAKNSDLDLGGFGLVYGAGLKFNFNQFGVRVNYTQHSKSAGQNDNVQETFPTDYISLDVLYHFSG